MCIGCMPILENFTKSIVAWGFTSIFGSMFLSLMQFSISSTFWYNVNTFHKILVSLLHHILHHSRVMLYCWTHYSAGKCTLTENIQMDAHIIISTILNGGCNRIENPFKVGVISYLGYEMFGLPENWRGYLIFYISGCDFLLHGAKILSTSTFNGICEYSRNSNLKK